GKRRLRVVAVPDGLIVRRLRASQRCPEFVARAQADIERIARRDRPAERFDLGGVNADSHCGMRDSGLRLLQLAFTLTAVACSLADRGAVLRGGPDLLAAHKKRGVD